MDGKAAAELLIDSFRDLFDFSRDVLWMIAPNGTITYVSPAITTLRGIDQATAMAQTIDQIHPPDSAARSIEYFNYMLTEISARRKPKPFSGELEYYCADGSILCTEVYALPILDEDGSLRYLAGVSRDISAKLLKTAQENAERKTRDAEFRSMLNLVLEHETRNALSMISPALEDNASSRKKENARGAVNNLIHLIRQIKLFTESYEHDETPNRRPISLISIIREIEQFLNPPKPLILKGEIEAPAWGEYSLAHMSLLQLIGNAIKYADHDTEVIITISIEHNKGAPGTIITIENTHSAPTPPDLSKLFDPFFRSQHVSHVSGSGLGLTIVARMAQALGGEVSIAHSDKKFYSSLWLPSSGPNYLTDPEI